jgi:putative flippase GtrA
MANFIDKLSSGLPNRLRTRVGKQFARFILVAAVSLAVSESALFVFTELLHLTGGISGVSAAALGALASYLMSRWAWERKGRPNVLRETIPFWIVSAGAWLVLGLATKLGLYVARTVGVAHGIKHFVIVGGIYFLANCLTFVSRFLIFHYVLFADRGRKAEPVEAESLLPIAAMAPGPDDNDRR